MNQIELLRNRQVRLKEQIGDSLDLLVGSVGRSPAMRQHNLTTKIDGKTVSRSIRRGLLPAVKKMTLRHKKVRKLIQRLSEINWTLLKLESD